VKNFSHFFVVVCLGFTGGGIAWADPAHPAAIDYVEDPLAPHNTTGTTARLGTAVGFLYNERVDTLALGLVGAGGKRWGRFSLEAEAGVFSLSERGAGNATLGDAERLGVIARYEVIRLGSNVVGGNSMLAFYVEGGADVAWNHWYMPAAGEATRVVPADTKRVETQAGFGVLLDHRLQEPIGFPHRIGWFLGWRIAGGPRDDGPAAICRGGAVSCKAAPTMPGESFTETSMLFQSSLTFTW
jgi:hypothetical protein